MMKPPQFSSSSSSSPANTAIPDVAVTVTAIEGNRQWLDGGSMFGNVPRPVWEKWVKPDATGRIELACRAMLVRISGKSGDKLILCEAGIGAFFDPSMADRYGVREKDHRLVANLAAIGITPDDIDFVILSHLHFDHAGGILPTFAEIQSGNKDLLFRNAKYVTGMRGFQRAMQPHARDRASFIPGMTDNLKASGRLILVDGETHPDVMPDVCSFRFSDGHTPGQMHTVIKGENAKMVFAGDLVPGRAWVHVPVSMGYDRFPELVIDEKEALYALAVPEHWWVFYTHDASCAASQVESITEGKRDKIRPCHEQASLVSFRL